MVQIIIDNHHIILIKSFWEKVFSFSWCCCVCGSLDLPLSAIKRYWLSDNLWSELRGIRVGTGIPGVIALGNRVYCDGKDYTAVYSKKGIVIEFDPSQSPYQRWIISLEDNIFLWQQLQNVVPLLEE